MPEYGVHIASASSYLLDPRTRAVVTSISVVQPSDNEMCPIIDRLHWGLTPVVLRIHVKLASAMHWSTNNIL